VHACGIRTDGTLWCWGVNTSGQLGDNLAESVAPSPVQVSAPDTWLDVDVGRTHSCATRTDRTLWCWGENGLGQIGDTTQTDRFVPTRVGSEADWSDVAVGPDFTCGLRSGTLWCWGSNHYGELGNGTTGGWSGIPAQVGTDTNWSAVFASQLMSGSLFSGHACALKTNGTLWCWGYNEGGQLGRGYQNLYPCEPTFHGCSDEPGQVGTATDWVSASLGAWHTCAIRQAGTLWCWGWDDYGELGQGSRGLHASPVRVGTDAGWSSVAASQGYTCALRNDGTRWCWGLNDRNQLGDGTTNNQDFPILVP